MQRATNLSFASEFIRQHVVGGVHHHPQIVGGITVGFAEQVTVIELVTVLLHLRDAELFARDGEREHAVAATDHCFVTLEHKGCTGQVLAGIEGAVGSQPSAGFHITALRLSKCN